MGVTFSRAVAQSEFSTIALLLIGVAFYDLIGVFGTAVLLGSQVAIGTSAMKTVALGKIGAASSVSTGAMAAATVTSSTVVAADGAAKAVSFLPTWRPGLIEVVLAGRVSDGLGLADIIFP